MVQATDLRGTQADAASLPRGDLSTIELTKPDGKHQALGRQPPAAAMPRWADLAQFAVVAVEFGLLVLIIRLFQLHNARFGELMGLAWFGFVVNHFLPLKLRLPFFTLLSVWGIKVIVGGSIAACVVGGGLVLIALCHLPIAFALRVGLLLIAGAILAALRVQWPPLQRLTASIHPAAWMLLGSMFMFRIIIYLYDLRHRTTQFSPFRALAYFFMLPNAAFPFFPLVDYKTFCTTHFNDAPVRIYQTGLRWILRGIVHLLLYRLVYQIVLVDPMEVTDLGGVARFLVATYLLYLKVSGQFHIIVGLLHLFGFNLPESFHLYLLSSSFLDLWRRVNIYWKDFITKVFFYPWYFRLKRLGPTWAMAAATALSLVATWLLHAYQSFWIRGEFGFSWSDTIFWWILAVMVLLTVLYEAKRGRARARAKLHRTVWTETSLALRTIAMFVTMCVLWSYWSHSTDELSWLARAATNVTLGSVVAIVLVLAGVGVAAVLFGHSSSERTEGAPKAAGSPGAFFSWQSAAGVGAAGCAILLTGYLPRWIPLYGTLAGDLLTTIREDRLNETDMAEKVKGYYEDLDVMQRDEQLAFTKQDAHFWPHFEFHLPTNDFMIVAPKPGYTNEPHGKKLTLNEWGMRDRPYTKAKPPGTYRIALLGTSHEMGHNIGDADTFENVLEERLNQEDTNSQVRKYEILNFSVGSYGAFQKLWRLESKAFDFDLDAVFFVSYLPEAERTLDHLAKVLRQGYEIPAPYRDFIQGLYEKAQVDASMSESRIKNRLKPYALEAIGFVFNRVAEVCRQRGVKAALVYRPAAEESSRIPIEGRRRLLELAQQAGLTLLDMGRCFEGVMNRHSLLATPSASDSHTNEYAHRLMADELYKLLHREEGTSLLKPRESAPAP